MIRITIELLPYGDEHKKKTIGYLEVFNDGSGNFSSGNYQYKLLNKSGDWKQGRIENFKRNLLTCYDLLYLILKDAVGKRNE